MNVSSSGSSVVLFADKRFLAHWLCHAKGKLSTKEAPSPVEGFISPLCYTTYSSAVRIRHKQSLQRQFVPATVWSVRRISKGETNRGHLSFGACRLIGFHAGTAQTVTNAMSYRANSSHTINLVCLRTVFFAYLGLLTYLLIAIGRYTWLTIVDGIDEQTYE